MFFSGTEITCDLSCHDSYPATNLTSSSYELKKKGFMVDYFIKPPVVLTLTFENAIFISHIIIGTQVGQQRSKGIELILDDERRLAKHVCQDPAAIDLCFQNYTFPGNEFKKEANDSKKLRLGQTQCLQNVTKLSIKIFQTFHSSVVCLSNLQIWGRPSSSLKPQLKSDLYSIWKALIKAKSSKSFIPSAEQGRVEVAAHHPANESSLENEMPEEFIDALTCKRMNVPMLLPCGQYVDRSSLDNYNDIESKWGRSPNDPFTGLIFTTERKAVFDAKLKSRIDAFVLGIKTGHNQDDDKEGKFILRYDAVKY